MAVVQAAGKDAWESVRDRVAKLFGRGRTAHMQSALERLEATASELQASITDGTGEAQRRLAAAWQARFEMLLEDLDGIEREEAAGQLREVVSLATAGALAMSAGEGSVAVGGSARFHAESGSVAAGVVHGGVRITNPLRPGADQS
jgi:hypothetical protein